jgi:hypothetical protein
VGKVVESVPTGLLGGKVSQGTISSQEQYLQSRSEATRHGTARTGKGRLSSRVVLRVELESDGVSGLSNNGVGLECEAATADKDAVICASGSG